jgi:tetratricopeptide (TPR) repeat protein
MPPDSKHLDGLPVGAGKDTLAYRSARFIRRHAVGVTVAALVALSLIGGIIATRRLSEQNPSDAKLQRSLATGFRDHEAALPHRQKALQVRERIAAKDPKNQQALFDLAAAHGELAESYENLHDSAEALDHARESQDLFAELVGSDAKNVVYRRNLALAYERIGGAVMLAARDETQPRETRLDNLRQARRAYAKSLEIFSALRDRGALLPSDAHQIEKFTGKIADTDKEIASLNR